MSAATAATRWFRASRQQPAGQERPASSPSAGRGARSRVARLVRGVANVPGRALPSPRPPSPSTRAHSTVRTGPHARSSRWWAAARPSHAAASTSSAAAPKAPRHRLKNERHQQLLPWRARARRVWPTRGRCAETRRRVPGRSTGVRRGCMLVLRRMRSRREHTRV